jgi:hypothetical protein
LDVNNGARMETYLIPGERGNSRRTRQKGNHRERCRRSPHPSWRPGDHHYLWHL